MKNSTKLKIIKWVERALKYKHVIQPPLIEQNRQIQEVRWEGILYEWDAKYDIKLAVNFEIAKEMLRLNVVDYKKERVNDGEYKVKARAFFIEPINRWLNEM